MKLVFSNGWSRQWTSEPYGWSRQRTSEPYGWSRQRTSKPYMRFKCLNVTGHYLRNLRGLARARREKSLYAFYDAGARPWLIIQIWDMLPTSYPECHLQHIFMFNMQGSYICTMRSGKTCSWELVQKQPGLIKKEPRQGAVRTKTTA